MGYVQPGKFLDGIVMSVFMMLLSGIILVLLGEAYRLIVVNYASVFSVISIVLDRAFPMVDKKWKFGLQDVLLLSCLICLLSMTHNDADAVEKQANKQKKERLKTMVPDKKD